MPDISKDTMMMGVQNSLLMISLNHSSAIIELATRMIAAGPQKPHNYKRQMAEFKRIHKLYSDQYEKAIKDGEELLNGR